MKIFITSKRQYDERISREAMEACESIVSEIGAELHDEVIQRVAYLRLLFERLENCFYESCQDHEKELFVLLRSEFHLLAQSIRSTSRVLLLSSEYAHGLNHDLELLCQNMEDPYCGSIHYFSTGQEIALTETVHKYLHRVVQELIHNAFKHSAAWNVWVRAYWKPAALMLEVEDDGSGFSQIEEFIRVLNTKNNTLRMRTAVIGARIEYLHGERGLLARVQYGFRN